MQNCFDDEKHFTIYKNNPFFHLFLMKIYNQRKKKLHFIYLTNFEQKNAYFIHKISYLYIYFI